MAAGDIFNEILSAKSVYYVPRGGSSRLIKAIVDYSSETVMAGLKGGNRPHMEILVRNNAVHGISSKEINTGGDKIQISMRYGRSVRTVRIVKIIYQDRGMLKLLAY